MAVYLSEQEDLIDIRMDNVFKAVFTKGTPESLGALARLLSALIGREVVSVSIIANEPPIDNLRDRQIRFDIQCKSSDGDYFNVEMSMNPDKFEPVRLEYYNGKMFTSQDIRGTGKTYRDLKESYQIAFLANRSCFTDKAFMHKFEYYDPKADISLGGRSRIITVELSKLQTLEDKAVSEMASAERWAYYFRHLTDKNKRAKVNEILRHEEGIVMASQVLINISRDEIERARLLSEYKYEVDTRSKVVEAKREGKREGKLEAAMNALKMGIPIQQAAQITGIPEDEILKQLK